MQLTNILRDIGEDERMGRVYVPQDELARFGVSGEDLAAGRVTEQFAALMRFQIERARELYRRAASGIPYLTNDGSRYCVQLMGTTYAGILDAIEQNGFDVFTRRAYVPFRRKAAIAFRHLLATDHAPGIDVPQPERQAGQPAPVRHHTVLT